MLEERALSNPQYLEVTTGGVEFPDVCFRKELFVGRPLVTGAVIDHPVARLRENAISLSKTSTGFCFEHTSLDFNPTTPIGSFPDLVARARLQQILDRGASFRSRVYTEMAGVDLSSDGPVPSTTISLKLDPDLRVLDLNCSNTTFVNGLVLSFDEFDSLAEASNLPENLQMLMKVSQDLEPTEDSSPAVMAVRASYKLLSSAVADWAISSRVPLILIHPEQRGVHTISTRLPEQAMNGYYATCSAPYRRFTDAVNLRQLVAHFSDLPLPYDENQLLQICEELTWKWEQPAAYRVANSQWQSLLESDNKEELFTGLEKLSPMEIAVRLRSSRLGTDAERKMHRTLNALLLSDDALFERVFSTVLHHNGGVVICGSEGRTYCLENGELSFARYTDDTIEHRRKVLIRMGKFTRAFDSEGNPLFSKSRRGRFNKDLEIRAQQKLDVLLSSTDQSGVIRLLSTLCSLLEVDQPRSFIAARNGKVSTYYTEVTLPGIDVPYSAQGSGKRKQIALKDAAKSLLVQLHRSGVVRDSVWKRAVIESYFPEEYAKALANTLYASDLQIPEIRQFFEENGFTFGEMPLDESCKLDPKSKLHFSVYVDDIVLMAKPTIREVKISLNDLQSLFGCSLKQEGPEGSSVKLSMIQKTIRVLEQAKEMADGYRIREDSFPILVLEDSE